MTNIAKELNLIGQYKRIMLNQYAPVAIEATGLGLETTEEYKQLYDTLTGSETIEKLMKQQRRYTSLLEIRL